MNFKNNPDSFFLLYIITNGGMVRSKRFVVNIHLVYKPRKIIMVYGVTDLPAIYAKYVCLRCTHGFSLFSLLFMFNLTFNSIPIFLLLVYKIKSKLYSLTLPFLIWTKGGMVQSKRYAVHYHLLYVSGLMSAVYKFSDITASLSTHVCIHDSGSLSLHSFLFLFMYVFS